MNCRKILRAGCLNGMKFVNVEQRCVAEADDTGFCPVHRKEQAEAVRPPREKRDLDADVLPWGEGWKL